MILSGNLRAGGVAGPWASFYQAFKLWGASQAAVVTPVAAAAGGNTGAQTFPALATGTSVAGYAPKIRNTSSGASNGSVRGNAAGDSGYRSATALPARGFLARTRFSLGAYRSDAGYSVVWIPASPSGLFNVMGLVKEAGDTTWHFITNAASPSVPTKEDTGLTPVAGETFDLFIYVPLGGESVLLQLSRLEDLMTWTHTFTTNLPAEDEQGYWWVDTADGGGADTQIDWLGSNVIPIHTVVPPLEFNL